MLELAIIGAGPYGLSIAAHAKDAGINYKVFGHPMEFWRTKTPPEMFIRTRIKYTNLIDPRRELTLKNYEREKKLNLKYPINRSTFANYGLWFIEKTGIEIISNLVIEINSYGDFYQIKTEDGNSYKAKQVIIGIGLTNSKYIPEIMGDMSTKLVSHTSDHTNYEKFENKRVLVLGGGQSAWESAALLHKNNAEVILAYRRNGRLKPEEDLNRKQLELADKFFYLTDAEKHTIKERFERPSVSDFLVELVKGKIIEKPNSYVIDVEPINKDKGIKVRLNDNNYLEFDHIIAATGYRFTLENIDFLSPIVNELKVDRFGNPVLNEYFESSLANLYFVGPAAAHSFGPAFKFIAGITKTCDTLINRLK